MSALHLTGPAALLLPNSSITTGKPARPRRNPWDLRDLSAANEFLAFDGQCACRAWESGMRSEMTAGLVSELEDHLGPWRARLAPQLSPVLERHHRNLLALVHSLEGAGHGPEVIRSSLRALLTSYEADLSAALQNGGVTS